MCFKILVYGVNSSEAGPPIHPILVDVWKFVKSADGIIAWEPRIYGDAEYMR